MKSRVTAFSSIMAAAIKGLRRNVLLVELTSNIIHIEKWQNSDDPKLQFHTAFYSYLLDVTVSYFITQIVQSLVLGNKHYGVNFDFHSTC